MAISSYFINKDWQYREILLGFKPLHRIYSSANLSAVLLETLQRYKIKDRVLVIVTDNILNNKTLVDTLQQSISDDITLIRVPCIAYII